MNEIIINKYLVSLGIKVNKCNRCSYIWTSNRKDKKFIPKCCPNCKSPYWNKERKRKNKKI